MSLLCGCVDINDAKVQIQHPDQVDPYQRNVLDKCPPHTNPHRLVLAQVLSTSLFAQQGAQMVANQQDFDKLWNSVTRLDDATGSISSLSQEPIVNWDQEIAYFLLIGLDNSCQRIKPYGDEMISDCYSITIPLYRYNEGTNCQPPGYFPVFIYIFPKTPLQVNIKWIYPTATPTAVPKPTATPTATPTPIPPSEDE